MQNEKWAIQTVSKCSNDPMTLQAAEKVVFPRMLKNGQMQGSRNPEE
jgi:hypothetical protein